MSQLRSCAIGNGLVVLCILAITCLFLGCSTTKKVDWNARVGAYTYDQAVAELGPPDKQATLNNRSTVAEWVTRRPGNRNVSLGTGFYGNGVGVGVGQTVNSPASDNWLRLVFDPDGRLSSWSRN